jgi:DNA polymerase III subunit delta'
MALRLSWQTIGQDKIIALLQKALRQNVLSHAYLLVGPRQVGKKTLAVELAMALNCRAEASRRPCRECPACRKIAAGNHPDVQILDLDSLVESEDSPRRTEIGIEQIKDMLHSAHLPPFEGNMHVYIINEAGNLSLDAANRLLKTLEEPPLQVVFLLLTENARLVPATVISRCQRLNLNRMKTGDMENVLVARWPGEPEKIRLLAHLSYGCPGWAIDAWQNPGVLVERHEKFDRLRAILAGNISERFSASTQLAQQFSKKRESVYETLDSWAGWWRDLLLVKAGCDHNIVNIDCGPDLAALAGSFSLDQIIMALRGILAAKERLKLNGNVRLVLESLMLDLPVLAEKIARSPAEMAAR